MTCVPQAMDVEYIHKKIPKGRDGIIIEKLFDFLNPERVK
jgi:hypothetical protein